MTDSIITGRCQKTMIQMYVEGQDNRSQQPFPTEAADLVDTSDNGYPSKVANAVALDFGNELARLQTGGKHCPETFMPHFLYAVICESLKIMNSNPDSSASSICLEHSTLATQWLRSSTEHISSESADKQGHAPDLALAEEKYFALMRHLVLFWSWILRGIRMSVSSIYPSSMSEYHTHLLALQQPIQDLSQQYRSIVTSIQFSDTPISSLNATLNWQSEAYIDNLRGLSSELNSLRTWLKPVDDVEEERTLQRTRRWPQTCQWIFSKQSYREWMLGILPSILWCHARPGSGKSVLSSFIAQQFHLAGEVCCFFPFRYNNEALRYPQNLLRTMAFHMAEQNPQIQARLKDISFEDLNVERARMGLLWQKVFINGIFQVSSTDPIYWIVDALDEAEPSEILQFLALLSDLQTSQTPIKVMLFSRYNRDIASCLSALPITVSEVLPDDNLGDMALYTKDRLANSTITLSDAYQKQILNTIVNNCSGTFLWVTKAIDALEQEELIADVLASLEHSAQGLTQFYDRIIKQMSNLQSKQLNLARTMLSWTTCAARPLFVAELAVALKEFGQLTDVASTIKNLCGQLLSIDKHKRVQPNHMTVQEYLKSSAPESFRVESKHWDHKIASFCLDVLQEASYADLQDASDSEDEDERPFSKAQISDFAEYACLYWHVHIGRTQCNNSRSLQVKNFLESPGGLKWIRLLADFDKLDQILPAVRTLKAWISHESDNADTSIPMIDRLQNLAARLGYSDDQYVGRRVNGVRQGTGTAICANGDHYTGKWKGDVREGKGVCKYASGNVYEGQWLNDEFHGKGRLSSPDGCTYDGDWVAGRRHGYGVMSWTWTARIRYEGYWANDRFHGYGKMFYLFGTIYDGYWAVGREHGHGKINYWNGDWYEGDFDDGTEIGGIKRHKVKPNVKYNDESKKTAVVEYGSGAKYEGEVDEEGLPSGEGVLHGSTGVSWTGPFREGRGHGHGVARRPNGGCLIGTQRHMVAQGHFIDINDTHNGGKYTGNLADFAREGDGKLESAFGYDYEGEFHRNEMHGKGVRQYHNGDHYEGVSKNGNMEGHGIMRYADGWVYDGGWEKDKKNTGVQEGTMDLPGWGKFRGVWLNDQIRSRTSLVMAEGKTTLHGLP